jgi:hypothetical protein
MKRNMIAMRKIAASLSLLATLQAPAAFAESASFRIIIETSSRYELKENVARSTHATSKVTLEVEASAGDKQKSAKVGPFEATETTQETMTIDRKSIRMQDALSGSDITVAASIDRGFFSGKVQRIVVSKDAVIQALGASLAEKGQSLLTQLTASVEGVNFAYNVNTSDLICEAQDSQMSCDLTAEIAISAKK